MRRCHYFIYPRSITLKYVTSSEVQHLCGLEPAQHSSGETLQRRRAVGDIMSDLTVPGIESHPSRAASDIPHHYSHRITMKFFHQSINVERTQTQ